MNLLPVFKQATPDMLSTLEEIRQAAFAPVFAGFRATLGDEIYEIAQREEDSSQGLLLATLLAPGSSWEMHVAVCDGAIAGFLALQLDHQSGVGEIGLNAVHPDYAGRGVGTAMYEYALAQMKAAGMRVATVSTGGDPAHAPARRAYRKAGFSREIPSVWMCCSLAPQPGGPETVGDT